MVHSPYGAQMTQDFTVKHLDTLMSGTEMFGLMLTTKLLISMVKTVMQHSIESDHTALVNQTELTSPILKVEKPSLKEYLLTTHTQQMLVMAGKFPKIRLKLQES